MSVPTKDIEAIEQALQQLRQKPFVELITGTHVDDALHTLEQSINQTNDRIDLVVAVLVQIAKVLHELGKS